MSSDSPWGNPSSTWSTSTRLTSTADRVRVHPYSSPVWVATPREEVIKHRAIRRRRWPCHRLSDLEIAGIIFALVGLAFHIASMVTFSWARAKYPNSEEIAVGIFPQCQFIWGCLPVGPVGCAAIVALIYGVSVPVLFTIYTTCCWRRRGGRYVEYATTANCFIACLGVLVALLLAGLRFLDFPLPGFDLDYSYYLEIGAVLSFLIAGILFLIHVCLQWK